jgi:ABC-type antimicrobial peptide transport system, permease component
VIPDGLQEILYSLQRNKLRTALTAFGVFWGIFMLVLLLGSGTGLQRGMEKGFSSDVRDSLWIRTIKTSVPYKGLALGRKVQLTESDITAIRQMIPSVGLISAENSPGSTRLVTYEQNSGTFTLLGAGKSYFEIKRYQEYRMGRKLNNLDDDEQRKVTVIGTIVKERLFGNKNPLGEQIIVNGVNFKVVGVFYDSGWEGRMSERLYIPLSTFQKTFGVGENISLITVTPAPGYTGDEVAEDIETLLKQRHNIAPEDRKAISVFDLAKQSAQISGTLNAITWFIWFVGLGTLTAGIVGISNIMIITVQERTVEIGIRKALGAPPWNIIRTILLEAVLVTAVAGYMGLVLAVGLLELVNYAMTSMNIDLRYFSRPEVDFSVAIASLIILIGCGVLAGFFPAWHAARISPIEAMRAQ